MVVNVGTGERHRHQPDRHRHLTVYPTGVVRPATTSVSFAKGRTVPRLVVVNVGTGGTVTFFDSSGTVDVIADLAGYYRP